MRRAVAAPVSGRWRAGALVLVALLHAGLALLLARAVIAPQRAPLPPTAETILYLTRPVTPPPQPAPRVKTRAPVKAPSAAAPTPLPSYATIPPAPLNAPVFAAPNTDLKAAIGDCTTTNPNAMTTEQRQRCGLAFRQLPRTGIPGGTPEKVKKEAVWAAEREAAKTALTIPCTYTAGIREEKAVLVDLVCALPKLKDALER